jgi:hypothetical protein
MTSFLSVKGKVAVEAFPDMSVKTSLGGSGSVKVARIENRVSLVPLKVVLLTEDSRFTPGDIVYVRGSHYTQPWAKEVHVVNGKTFILIPDTAIEIFHTTSLLYGEKDTPPWGKSGWDELDQPASLGEK